MGAPNKRVCRLPKLIILLLLSCPAIWSQISVPKPTTPEAQLEVPKDTLGRNTPRGTVIGFLNAARKGNFEIAALYLNTPQRGEDAENLAHQLAAVLNRRLPARLNEISDKPEGSLPDPRKPDEDLIGTIKTSKGDLDILVERVDRGKAGKVWLFARKSLASIPDAFAELNTHTLEKYLPEFLIATRILSIPLFEWLAVFVGLPFVYFVTGLVNRLMSWSAGELRRRALRNPDPTNPPILLPPVRLLLLAVFIRWLSSKVELPLLARQFWSTTSLMIAISGCVWLLMLMNSWSERYVVRHRRSLSGSASVLRLVRRVIDALIIFSGLLFILHHFGINPTAALAGLGVGGIAIALAAQKTLENVIAGISLVADEAVRVGDFLKIGDVLGTVEEVGLRSTRIRTLDRTVVCLPNAQIANVNLETFSARDKYWFHPVVGLRYETTGAQLRSVISGVRNLLNAHPRVEADSVRVRFISLAAHSMNVEIFAYVTAHDWTDFLAVQEELLLSVVEIVESAGAAIAFPSQTLYLEGSSIERLSHINPNYIATRAASGPEQPRDFSLKRRVGSES
jgi:MscS family membrane protein